MTRSPSRDPESYEVGYRKPPASTRFRSGASGNPRGRPRGSRSISAILRDILHQRIMVTENGKARRLSSIEIMMRRLSNDAMKGEPRAIRFLLTLAERYGDAPTAEVDVETMNAEDQAILAQYLGETSPPDVQPRRNGDGGLNSDDITKHGDDD